MSWPSKWGFGVPPLSQMFGFARAIRALTETVLSLDAPAPEIDELVEQVTRVDQQLRARTAVTPATRVGKRSDDPTVRPYIDHSVHVGSFNPVFPEYAFTAIGPERAAGTVRFSLVYEGPPGIAHGGFIAVFFDLVISHHNADVGVAGATKALEIRYRRPTPLETTLRFEISRAADDREIVSDATLCDGDTVLATARSTNVAGRRDKLPRFGVRSG